MGEGIKIYNHHRFLDILIYFSNAETKYRFWKFTAYIASIHYKLIILLVINLEIGGSCHNIIN